MLAPSVRKGSTSHITRGMATLDLSDLIEDEYEACGAGGAGGPAGPAGPGLAGPSAPSSGPSRASIAEIFCRKLHSFLLNLSTAFPERAKLADWLKTFETTVLPFPMMHVYSIEKWHREMTVNEDGTPRSPTLYTLTSSRDMKAVLTSSVSFFRSIDGWEMYCELEDDACENLCERIDILNTHAQMFSEIPASIMDKMGQFMPPAGEINADTIQDMVQKVVTGIAGSSEGFDQLSSLAGNLTHSISNGTFDPTGLFSMLSSAPMQEALCGVDIFKSVSQAMSNLNLSRSSEGE